MTQSQRKIQSTKITNKSYNAQLLAIAINSDKAHKIAIVSFKQAKLSCH